VCGVEVNDWWRLIFVTSRLRVRGGLRRISILYWMWQGTCPLTIRKILNAFFLPFFKSQTNYSWGTLTLDLKVWDEEQNKPPYVGWKQIIDLLLWHWDCHKSMGSDGIHLRVLRKLAEVIAKLLSIIYQRSWKTGKVLEDC